LSKSTFDNEVRSSFLSMKMRVRPYILFAVTALFSACLALSAQAQTAISAVNGFDSLVRNYNAVVLNNATFSNSNMEGAIAVRGNLTTSSGSIAYKTSVYANSSDPTLYVGGQLKISGETKLQSGYAALPNSAGSFVTVNGSQRHFLTTTGGKLNLDNLQNPLAKTSPTTNPTPANWNWASIESTAISLSSQLAAAAVTGTIGVNTGNQTLTFSPNSTDAGVVVFNFDASLLNGNSYGGQNFSNLKFNIGSDQTFVVNVLNANGKTLIGQGVNFNTSSFVGAGGADQLLWNITGSGDVTLMGSGDFYGSILAPEATLSNGSGRVEGQILAGGLTYSNAQLHYNDFSPTAVLVPEPGTYALWTLGLCVAGLVWHRRRRATRR